MASRKKRSALAQRLILEAREYLADVRDLIDSVRSPEGLMALVLVVAVLGLVAGWFIIGLGFDNLLSAAESWNAWRPTMCRNVENFQAVFLIVGGVTFALVAVLAIGEMMRFIDRVRRGLPHRPKAVLIPVLLMLLVGIAGIAVMRLWC